jgi:signal transduction histidine kinase
VNHDLKNAFPPIRNVIRHLAEVSHSPSELQRVFEERRASLDSGLAYLDDLSTSWRRLAARPDRVPCDVVAVAHEVAAGRQAGGGPVRVTAAAAVPAVWADPFGLRRILENLVANACESGAENVMISLESTAAGGAGTEPRTTVQITVEDDGPGLPEAARARAFEPYWTTKPDGSGLGLAIVRRLVSDCEGSVRIDDGNERGTRVTVTLPAGGGG